ncbi:MAG: hypothetical protein K6T73_06885 [Candidatus Bathyarchaeota archaeon]|nr:hypothetical protein [Candidatus Bathyarchaeota archaeon]
MPPITGDVVSNISLTRKVYTANKPLEGSFNLRFYWGDLIPADSNVTFEISSVKCRNFYVCSDGSLVPWEKYDPPAGICKNVTTWVRGPWEECGEDKYYRYPNQLSPINCTGSGMKKKCCDTGTGLGRFYDNLDCGAGKECWDSCKIAIRRKLVDFIAISTTPSKGNFTNGTFNNVNGSEPIGQGYGFGACPVQLPPPQPPDYIPYIIYPVTGQAVSGSPALPDLVVTGISVKEFGIEPPAGTGLQSSPATKKVYAKIKNQGSAAAGAFVVLSCWYRGMVIRPDCNNFGEIPNLPQNCKAWAIQSLSPGQETEVMINDLSAMYDHSLFVNVDYCTNSIVTVAESDETNNEKNIYLGCNDPDLENIYVRGDCVDIRGMHTDYCGGAGSIPSAPTEKVAAVPSKTLYEYICEPEGIGIACNAKQIYCENGCSEGRCLIPSGCVDSDNGMNYFVKGMCSDFSGAYWDECVVTPTETYLAEYYCTNGTMAQCAVTQYACVCEEGRCLEVLPDLTVIDIQRKWFDSIEGTKIVMKNLGGQVNYRSFFVKATYKNLGWEQEYQINQPIGPNAVFTLDVRDKNISGQFVDAVVYVDSRNNVVEVNENNNELSKWLLPYSCEYWDNNYVAYLSNLGLRSPDYEGNYILNASVVHGNVVMSYYTTTFEVRAEEPTHKVCQNGQCVIVAGEGEDQCDESADCRGVCNEYWQYTPWSSCVDGKKQRECYDARHCNTTFNKPTACVKVGNKYFEMQSCCVQEWSCDDWSVCYEYRGETIQSMTCEDIHKCDPQNYTSVLVRNCCIEEWDCKWGPCVGGRQEKVCVDLNNCGSEFTKPAPETRSCQGVAWWVWVIIGVVIVGIILTILLSTGAFKKKPVVKAEETKEEVPKEVKEYIKQAHEQGMSKEEIKTQLAQSGWSEDVISKALK